jgi:type I restriction enzyme S subunit
MSAVLEKVKELPDGWVSASLSDCVEILDSRRIPVNNKERLERVDGKSCDELYPYYGATGQVGMIDDFIFEGEHLLIGEDGAPFFDKSKNVAYLVRGKFWVNNHAHILKAMEGVTLNRYLLHFLNKFNYKGFVNGTTRLKLNQANLKKIPVHLAPPEQQKRIVAKIEELFSHIDAGIEALKKAKQLLKQYRQSILKAAVTGDLTKEWREANKAKFEPASQLLERILRERRQKWGEQQLEQFKAKGKMPKDDKWKEKYKKPLGYSYEGELPSVPKTWIWVSPEQIASTDKYALAIGPFGSNLKVSDYKDEGVPLVFVRNIRAHNYDKGGAKYVTPKKAIELKAHSISGGDVLITKMGEPPGDASIYPSSAPDAIITADCVKWRFSQMLECPELYVHIINSQLIKSQVLKRTKGVAQKKISLGTFKSVAFPLPPLDEQGELLKQIDEKFYTSDRLLKELEIQLIKAEKNKQSILVSAFSGQLVKTHQGSTETIAGEME